MKIPESPKMPTASVKDARPGFVVLINSDLTEGRGIQQPGSVSLNRSTARRLAVAAGVQGSDAPICAVPILRVMVQGDGVSREFDYGPVKLREATKEDLKADAFEAAIERAEELGLSPDDVSILKRGVSS